MTKKVLGSVGLTVMPWTVGAPTVPGLPGKPFEMVAHVLEVGVLRKTSPSVEPA